jgi:ATP-dependent RNA helicase DeaD
MLDSVAERREAGRLDLYTRLVGEHLVANPELDAVELAATLAALFVGDKGPKSREALAEEAEAAELAAAARANKTRRDGDDGRRPHRAGYDDDRPRTRAPRDVSGRERGIRRDAVGTRYRLAVGHTHGVQPRGIVGALTNEGGLTGKDLGKIDIFPSFSLVDIATPLDAATMEKIGRAKVGGRALRITVDQGAPTTSRKPRRD